MTEISCELCMDLMPLVNDGVASEDSQRAVARHIQTCDTCRERYTGQALPQAEGEQALSRAVKRVQTLSALVLLALVLLGVCLSEMILRGSALFFLMAVLAVIKLVQFARKKENFGLKKVFALTAALALVCGLAVLGNLFFGNPIAKEKAETAAMAYLQGKFPESDYYVEEISYDSKVGRYEAQIHSLTSADTYFTIDIRPNGMIRYDTYEGDVLTGQNTAHRLDKEYRNLVEPVLLRLNLNYRAYVSCGLEFTWGPYNGDPGRPLYLLNGETLQLDGEYDLAVLSAQAGHLSVTVEHDTVSEETAAQILLDVKALLEEAGLTFRSIDLELRHPMSDEFHRPEGSVSLTDFPYEDIERSGLTERIRRANGQ